MFLRHTKFLLLLAILLRTAFLADAVFAQRPVPGPGPATRPAPGTGASTMSSGDPTMDIDVYVKGADGGPLDVTAVVTLTSSKGEVADQGTTLGGNIKFRGVTTSQQYVIQVAAPGYENAYKEVDSYNVGSRIVIEMRPALNGETGAGSSRILLAPKAQKELGKALEALRANKPEDARGHLDAAYRRAPNHPAVNYLFGVYFLQMKDQEKAKSYWAKALEFDPKHLGALLSLSEALIREKKLLDAESYAKRALEADASSWRAHAVVADIFLKEHFAVDAVKEAERALELGHGQAANVQPLLARALVEGGNPERAEKVLQEYVRDHPNDAAARKQLESLQSSVVLTSPSVAAAIAEAKPSAATETAISLPLPSNWLPPDVDERVPPVQSGEACQLEEVVHKAGKRVEEFIKNVDRFTATEFLKHESVNKWGITESPETRKFNYLVSIDQYRPGYFSVMEYRGSAYSPAQFPGGVETNGLPTLSLIFHPNNAGNFAMSCEGLGRWNGSPAWQIHFRQRPDKPNTIRAYKIGQNGPAYAVALRGRAWIAADSYQIVRMETDLVAPRPEIRLFADHTLVEYGPVRFRNRNVEMWLPQTAEVYFDWRGQRMHRRHSFSNYLLFSVDEKQRIAEPKVETESPSRN
jgi:tetratricopeptide (TPR) repeat protein